MKYNKPIVIAGNGIRLSNTVDKFKEFIEKYQIPFVISYLGKDLLPTDHPLNIGVMGIKGNKAANLATQNADLIINLGSRLSTGQIGYDEEFINKDANKIMVDIDNSVYQSCNYFINHFVHLNLSESETWIFLYNNFDGILFKNKYNNWIKECQQWKEEFKIVPKEYKSIDIYSFIIRLSEIMSDDDIVISDAGSSYFACAQVLNIRGKQRWITSGAQADMGFALPASIGACIARGKKRVICVTGDASFQLNIQELATIRNYNLPIIIFVLNNQGMVTIRNTQDRYFNGNYVGSKDMIFPNLYELSNSYNMIYSILHLGELIHIKSYLNNKPCPKIVEVICDPNQVICGG